MNYMHTSRSPSRQQKLHPKGYNPGYKGLSGAWYKSHPGHLPLLYSRQNCETLREFQIVSNTASSKRLQYVWTIFPTQNPINSFACKGSTLIYRHEPPCWSSCRTCLTGTTHETRPIVRCKDRNYFYFHSYLKTVLQKLCRIQSAIFNLGQLPPDTVALSGLCLAAKWHAYHDTIP